MFLDSPTWKIIFAALKSDPDTDVLIHMCAEDFDEDELLQICSDHGILLIVNESLKKVAQRIFSVKGLEPWRSAVAASTLHNLEMHRELKRLTALFADAGFPVVPFKGPRLSESLYGDSLLRMSADLDLLVSRDYVTAVVDLMIAEGYQLTSDRNDLDRWLEPNTRYFHCGLLNPAGKWLVELHWLLFAGWRRAHLPPSRTQNGFPGGVGDELETLLYLCTHGAHHWWIELKWVVDVERCVWSANTLDWTELLKRAKDRGCLRVTCLAMVLAQQVCGLELPHVVVDAIRKDQKSVRIANRVTMNWNLPKSQQPSLPWKLRYLLDCRERLQDKIGMSLDYPLMRSLSSS